MTSDGPHTKRSLHCEFVGTATAEELCSFGAWCKDGTSCCRASHLSVRRVMFSFVNECLKGELSVRFRQTAGCWRSNPPNRFYPTVLLKNPRARVGNDMAPLAN